MTSKLSDAATALRAWPARRWAVAAAAALVTMLVIGLPTDVVPNPVFGRSIEVTWWSYPALVVSAILGGLLVATYIRTGAPDTSGAESLDRPGRLGSVGGFMAYLAVGCPVCNKLVLLALGTTGAMQWFAPVQPVLAVGGAVLLAWALHVRLRGEVSCPVPAMRSAVDG